MRHALDTWIDDHADEIIATTRDVLRIPSVKDEATAGPGAPFGRSITDALDHTLGLCARLGMEVENFGGYAGHATFGDGREIVAALGHLDVVPPGNGWSVDPWGATLAGDALWGRGAVDDKGPTFAALWGAKAVLDATRSAGVTLSRRVRLIFGGDEESGWDCMTHYFGAAGQPRPYLAFTPDAYFPLIHAEKGAFNAVAARQVAAGNAGDGVLRVETFASGLRPNMVPDAAEAVLRGGTTVRPDTAAPGITVEPTAGGGFTVRAVGRGAHGSTPDEGENAAAKLLRWLAACDALTPADRAWAADLARRAATDGSGVGIAGSDAVTGPLTNNLGVVTKGDDGTFTAVFNVRYPATWDGDGVMARFRASLAETGWDVTFEHALAPLYVPTDEEPVKTLLRVYREHTGDDAPPGTMGGRTYATAVAPRGVAFGPVGPGETEFAHQADERIPVERLLLCARIYAHALYELAR